MPSFWSFTHANTECPTLYIRLPHSYNLLIKLMKFLLKYFYFSSAQKCKVLTPKIELFLNEKQSKLHNPLNFIG